MIETEKRPVGRPRIELDPGKAEVFGKFRATYQTMAEFFNCSVDTIQRAMNDDTGDFSKAYKKGFAECKLKISEAQIKCGVENLNPTMLIWLGKQYLGQREPGVPEKTVEDEEEIKLTIIK